MSDRTDDESGLERRGVLHPEGVRALRELAAGLAHEMNNTLGVILGNVHLCERQLPPDHPAHRFLKEIGRVTDETQLTTKLLATMARGASASARPVVLDEAVERAASQADGSIELQLGAPSVRVRGDLFLIEETLLSVLGFLCADRPNAGLQVRTGLVEDQVELAIEDETGPTPTPDELYNVFAPYRSLAGRGHAGLRLTQLAELAQRFGGRVDADIPEAGGLGLYLRLPIAEQ
jgi:two-component system, NtrC family, sensor kinase